MKMFNYRSLFNTSIIEPTQNVLAKLATRTKILVGFSVPLSLMAVIAIVVYFSIGELLATSTWVKHTQKVIADAKELEKLMIDMETGERGFLITGKENFVEPFVKSQQVWDKKIEALQKLVKDNPEQVSRLESIDKLEKNCLKMGLFWIEY